jgi:hypothetical protein
MFQREKSEVHTCPNCGNELKSERGELRCSQHGVFFAYGPNLVVRAPQQSEGDAKATMPWEAARKPA